MLLVSPSPFKATTRKAIPFGWKVEAHCRDKGRCCECGAEVPITGAGVEYDHRLALALGGEHAVANIAPICPRPCHKDKTARDVAAIAEADRRARVQDGTKRSGRPISSPGFNKTMTKGFDGKVRPRSVRATKREDRPSDWVRDDLETSLSRASGRGER